MRLSIAEIIKKTVNLQTEEEKIEWLSKNNTLTLRMILRYTYDENIKFLVPESRPPWKKNGLIDVEGRLYNETRRLNIFLKGGKYDGKLKQHHVERLFIEILEGVDDKDAEILSNMIEKKPIAGISKDVIIKAFPNIFEENFNN